MSPSNAAENELSVVGEPQISRKPIRLVVQQQSIAKYRVPIFRELAKFPDIELKLLFGNFHGLPNENPEGFESDFVPLRELRFGDSRVFWHSAQWSYASKKKSDVLLLTWNARFVSLLPALLRAKAAGVPTILWGHGYSKQAGPVRDWIRTRVARLATALLFYNTSAAQEHLAQGWEPRRVFVAHNCLDQEPIRKAKAYWESHLDLLNSFREEQQLGDSPVVLFVSRLQPKNHVDWLIEATTHLARDHPKIQVIVIGDGEKERSRLKAIAQRCHVLENIRFVDAIYDEKQIAAWFLCADLFCYPANIGLSLLHSFGYGVPVVTSDDIGSHNPEIEFLQHEDNGLLYRDGDPESLAQAIDRILQDRDLRAQMSAAAQETASKRFTLENMVEQMAAAVRFCAKEVQK